MKFYLCILVSNLRSFLLCICSDIRLEHLSSWYLAFRNIDFWQRIRRCLDIRLWSRFRDLCIPLCTCSGACPHSSCTSPQHRTFKMCLEAFFKISKNEINAQQNTLCIPAAHSSRSTQSSTPSPRYPAPHFFGLKNINLSEKSKIFVNKILWLLLTGYKNVRRWQKTVFLPPTHFY